MPPFNKPVSGISHRAANRSEKGAALKKAESGLQHKKTLTVAAHVFWIFAKKSKDCVINAVFDQFTGFRLGCRLLQERNATGCALMDDPKSLRPTLALFDLK